MERAQAPRKIYQPTFIGDAQEGAFNLPFSLRQAGSVRVASHIVLSLMSVECKRRRLLAFGRWLRRFSVDELPQLINVLRGDMSLVGPRPHALAHDVQYSRLISNYPYRHHVRPGITGWAQVNGFRGETPTVDKMKQRVELDLWYATNWSFWLDLRILFWTVLEICRTRNAF